MGWPRSRALAIRRGQNVAVLIDENYGSGLSRGDDVGNNVDSDILTFYRVGMVAAMGLRCSNRGKGEDANAA